MIGWLDCSSGVAGDMLLAALLDSGVPIQTMQAAIDAVCPEPVRLRAETVQRAGLRAMRVHVDGVDSATHRTWADIRLMIERADLAAPVRQHALAAFARLADAEATVHGTTADHVHFHEVGALDAIADVVGAAAGFAHLGLDAVHASPVAVGSGTVQTQHGRLPVPAPAVVELLKGVPTHGGGAAIELATPTGAALLTTVASSYGEQPPMSVHSQGFGAGGRELPDRSNVVRLVFGEPASTKLPVEPTQVLEANVDDMDPRIWPPVLARMLEAGASDAWLVPILMKKGRPGHTVCALVDADAADRVRAVLFAETTTIGVRETPVHKRALDRAEHTVEVRGGTVRVKTATVDGAVVNAQPEYDDVAAIAAATGDPVKVVMATAIAAIHEAGLGP